MENSESIIEITPNEVVYQQDKAIIDTQIATAKHYPRNVKQAITNAIATVSMDEKTAATCIYALPRGGRKIAGPSVHLARIIAQLWGNLRIDARVTNIDATHITSQAVCFDLETNVAIKTEVKRSIVDSKGNRYKEDMITVTGNAGNAIALRNAIFNVIPKAIVDKVYQAAQSVMLGDISDEQKLITRRKQVIDGLKDTYNLKESEILSAVGKAAVSNLTADDLVTLIGIGQAIKDGDTDVDSAFRNSPQPQKKAAPTVSETEAAELKSEALNMLKQAKSIEDVDMVVDSYRSIIGDPEIKNAIAEKRNTFGNDNGELPL